jgi:hypothetical protein
MQLPRLRLFVGNAPSDLDVDRIPFHKAIQTFEQDWREMGRQRLEVQLQEMITASEAGQSGCIQIRPMHYHTQLGTIRVRRRIYQVEGQPVCHADDALDLPAEPWLPHVEEVASALGIGSEFPNATRLFRRWTGVEVSEHGLANRVEAVGALLAAVERQAEAPATAPLDSTLARQVQPKRAKPRVYVGADGTMVPRNEGQGYNEARVGVVFWEKDILTVGAKRREIREKQYVATMQDVGTFAQQLFTQYAHVVGERPCETLFLGDGALWIWSMAGEYYPEAIQILDFYHVSEYVSDVAKAVFPEHEVDRKRWLKEQQEQLKASNHLEVFKALESLDQSKKEIKKACEALTKYLTNNVNRIDYKTYLAKGYYIGSGVVESSNRKVVTQRVKQAGMHWSIAGVDGVITLRAAYCSSGDRWENFWRERTTLKLTTKPKRTKSNAHRTTRKRVLAG